MWHKITEENEKLYLLWLQLRCSPQEINKLLKNCGGLGDADGTRCDSCLKKTNFQIFNLFCSGMSSTNHKRLWELFVANNAKTKIQEIEDERKNR